jgi:hypothetical protein
VPSVKFSFNIEVDFISNGISRGWCMSDSEWVDRTVSRFKHALAEKARKDEVFLTKQKLRQSHIADLWGKLRTAFYGKVGSINKGIGIEVLTIEQGTIDSFTIRRNEPKTARLPITCNRDTCEITLAIPGTKEAIALSVGIEEDSGKSYLALVDGTRKEPEEVAALSIEELLGYGL